MHTALLEAEELAARLHKMEGQVRGVGHMITDGAPAVDVLTQVAAVRGALDAVAAAVAERELSGWARSDEQAAAMRALISRLVRW
jgi:DNA-binding FrmR family transcriptional regulator